MCLGVIKSLFLQIPALYSDKIPAYLVVSFWRNSYSVSYIWSWRIKKVFDNVEKSPPFVKIGSLDFFLRATKAPRSLFLVSGTLLTV